MVKNYKCLPIVYLPYKICEGIYNYFTENPENYDFWISIGLCNKWKFNNKFYNTYIQYKEALGVTEFKMPT